jgi:hypothetical protein
MAMPKKYSHMLDVDGRTYRWRVTTRDGLHRLRVDAVDGTGQLLTIEIPAAADPWLDFSIQSGGVKGGKGLHPPGGMGEIKWALVQQAVRFALDHGWDPDAARRGSATFIYRNHRFRPKADAKRSRPKRAR